jgi:hypothetical protein
MELLSLQSLPSISFYPFLIFGISFIYYLHARSLYTTILKKEKELKLLKSNEELLRKEYNKLKDKYTKEKDILTLLQIEKIKLELIQIRQSTRLYLYSANKVKSEIKD